MEGQEIQKQTLSGLLGQIVKEMENWIIISDCLGKIIYANDCVYKTCGIEKSEVLGKNLCTFVGTELTEHITIERIHPLIKDGKRFEFISNRVIEGNKCIYLRNTISLLGNGDYYLCVSKNITNTQKLKDELYHINYFDAVTQLPNQNIFNERIEKLIKCSRLKNSTLSVTLLDLRGMSEINSIYGVCVGDYVIKEVIERIKKYLIPRQELFKYRGSTFAIIEENPQSEEQIAKSLEALKVIVDEPIKIQGSYIYIKFCAGIAFYPKHSIYGRELVKMAQIALNKAKQDYRSMSYLFYSQAIRDEAENALKIEKEMHLAVQNDEFLVYYQPFIDLVRDHMVGMEALIRRQKNNGEIIFPSSFITILEQMNLIEKVGLTVLEKVCKQLRQWLDQGYKIVPVSINLSAVQLKNPSLANDIKAVLKRYEISPKYIVLEITETTVMEDIISANRTINELREDGFAISIDDFGTGYASIGYLKKFSFDHLKIDISFVREIVRNRQDRAIVEAIISIAKTLNLRTIAEGIENEEQLDVMSELGCEMGQGFFWDRPISARQIEDKYLKICL